MTTLVKKNICVKILLSASIRARKAALVRNYFSRRNNFCLNSLSLLPNHFDQINADVLCRRVNYRYLATFMCPVVFLLGVGEKLAQRNIMIFLRDDISIYRHQVLIFYYKFLINVANTNSIFIIA